MSAEGLKSRQDAEQKLIERAADDADFRRQLVSDPRPAIEKALGVELPPDVHVTVLQETDRQVYLVLPAASSREDGALTDSELSAVAGGLDRAAQKAPAPRVGDPQQTTEIL